MGERQNYTMTQADYDQLIERITAARKTSGMFLSGGMPMSDVQQTANWAWQELGQRMGFDGMSVQPGGSKLQFSAVPVTPSAPVAVAQQRAQASSARDEPSPSLDGALPRQDEEGETS